MISSTCITTVIIAIRARGRFRDREARIDRSYGASRVRITIPSGPQTKRTITLEFTAAEFIVALQRRVADG